MYGKTGENCPNFGLKRTEEQKERYRQIALTRDDTNRIEIIQSNEYREKMSESQKILYSTTNHAEKVSAGMKRYWDNNPERRHEHRERAIKLLAEGKIGPQAPYKTEWKYNPFTDQKEYMHSSWESIFLDHMIKEGIPITKKHDYRFQYTDFNGIERDYIPDFVEIDGNVIYEVKGGQDDEAELKAYVAQDWCNKNGFEYIMLYKKEIKSL